MAAPQSDERDQKLRQAFLYFAETVYSGYSPLYELLAMQVAADPELLALAAHTPEGQPAANLLLGAVHFLLLSGVEHPLSRFFPTVSGLPALPDDPWPVFRRFCLENATKLTRLILTRRVQTNEVRRCTAWLPAMTKVHVETGQPLALIEFGTSAGLNLLWDHYAYDYGTGRVYGAPDSPVLLSCVLRGAVPPLPDSPPPVASRVGIDLHPIDVHDPDATRWLQALCWPEQVERQHRLLSALALARKAGLNLIKADAFTALPEQIDAVPHGAIPCVMHSFTLYQWPESRRQDLVSLLDSLAKERDLVHLAMEWLGEPAPRLTMTTYTSGRKADRLLAECDQHGSWLDWK